MKTKTLSLCALVGACLSLPVNALPILDVQFSQNNEVVSLRVDGLDLGPVVQTALYLDGSLYEAKSEPKLVPYKIAGNIASLGWQFETGPHTIWYDYLSDAGELSRLTGDYTVAAYIPPVPDSTGVLPFAGVMAGLLMWRRRSFDADASAM